VIEQQQRLEEQKPPRFYWLRRQKLPAGLYILGYHSILDEENADEWESAYVKVATRRRDFQEQVAWLQERMTPLSTSEALTRSEFRDGAYFLLHFDDAYATLMRHAAPILKGMHPAVFVNGDFAVGKSVYYRVLVALMAARGQAQALVDALQAAGLAPSVDAAQVFDAYKNHYRAGVTEEAALLAWNRANPGEALPAAHLGWSDLQNLESAGWQIGNHTRSHHNLADLTFEDHETQIAGNQALLREAGLNAYPWLAYPNGLARHVGSNTVRWLEQHPDFHAFFLGGGVNFIPSRMGWRRIAVGDWSLDLFVRQVKREAVRSLRI
jgi:peptidoglycan/xylan/chitin deacetylase (PgdA/CDA1 family)